MTPVTKYWVCKMTPAVVNEALECLGGNGYVEDGPLARVYREAPLNAIWEGSGNVMALDLLRVLERDPEPVALVLSDIMTRAAATPELREPAAHLQAMLQNRSQLERRGRELIEGLAKLAAGLLLAEHAPAAVSDAFLGSRFMGSRRYTYGQGLARADVRALIERSLAG